MSAGHASPRSLDAGETLSYVFLLFAVCLALFIGSGMWFYPANVEGEELLNGSSLIGIAFNAMYGAMLISILLFHRHVLLFIIRFKLLSVLILVHFAATLTSIAPANSFGFSIRLTLLVYFFGAAALIVTPRHMLRILVFFFAACALINLAYILALPRYGTSGGVHAGAWRGMFTHKNQFGYFCAYGLVLFATLSLQRITAMRKLAALFLAAVCALMMIQSRSGGSLSSAAAGFVISAVVLYTPRLGAPSKLALVFVALLLTIAVIPFADSLYAGFLGLIGKDPSLTNRADIWNFYLKEAMRSPILGLGPEAHTSDLNMRLRLRAALGSFIIPSPHSGYIATLLQTGVVGLAAYLLVMLRILWGGVRRGTEGGTFLEKTLFVFACMHLVRGTVETAGSVQLNVYFAFIVIAYVYLSGRKTHALHS